MSKERKGDYQQKKVPTWVSQLTPKKPILSKEMVKEDVYTQFKKTSKDRFHEWMAPKTAYLLFLSGAIPLTLFVILPGLKWVKENADKLNLKLSGQNEQLVEYDHSQREIAGAVLKWYEEEGILSFDPEVQRKEVQYALINSILPKKQKDVATRHYRLVKQILDTMEKNKETKAYPYRIDQLNVTQEEKEILRLFDEFLEKHGKWKRNLFRNKNINMPLYDRLEFKQRHYAEKYGDE